ncbi:hypothetical protein ACJMK2_042531 [Sinanodonta woodiana]|uniref:Uncharacterized protein n=1 Tax=Sinanodonta woodiana TaxID=1069815 RepID=A0ABD3WAZ1_SINWO
MQIKSPENLLRVEANMCTDIATESPQCPVRCQLESSTNSLNNMEPVPPSDDCTIQCDPVQPPASQLCQMGPITPVRTSTPPASQLYQMGPIAQTLQCGCQPPASQLY